MTGWTRRADARDEGMGMILVIGIMGLITALIAVAGTVAVSAIRSSHNRVTYEQALATAENGVDYALARLQKAFDEYNRDWPTPSNEVYATTAMQTALAPTCTAPEVNQTATTDAAQRTEAITVLKSLAASGCLVDGGVGEFTIWKPRTPLVGGLYPKFGKVYAMGFVPSYDPGNPLMKTRVVKAEYLFMPYRPTNAVLTSGALTFDSSTMVTTAYGIDPSEASIHTNATLSVDGNPTVTGAVTSTGTSTAQSNNFTSSQNPGGVVGTQSKQRIPPISARGLYARTYLDHAEYRLWAGSVYQGPWYDLCPDGSARPMDAAGPCAADPSLALNPGATGSFRGWTYDSTTHVWTASNVTQDGIYYIHEGSVAVGPGNGAINNITVIAGAENEENCSSKRYGNIEWDRFDMKAPSMANLFMYADSDIVTHANWSAGQGVSAPPVISGMFIAGDQMHMETSSAGAVGSVVVGDNCTVGNPDLVTTNEIKNPNIYYDPNADAPFTSIISTTLWLEYVGN